MIEVAANLTEYPWMNGFYSVVDGTTEMQAGELVSKPDILQSVGVFACKDGLCGDVCSHSYDRVGRMHDLKSSEQYDFVDGARAALNVLTATTVIPEQRETRYV